MLNLRTLAATVVAAAAFAATSASALSIEFNPDFYPAADPRWAGCSALENQRSAHRSDTPASLTFSNETDSYRSVYWMGFDGQPVNYANLNPGETFTVTTYLGHPWMLTDAPGNCIEMFQPQLGVRKFHVEAPTPFFGTQ